jgi:serine/threonine protein kinase
VSFGILAYKLVCGHVLFDDSNSHKLMSKITSCDIVYPSNPDPVIKGFLQKLLIKNPKRRVCFNEIMDNPFWNDFNFERVLQKKYKTNFIQELLSSKSIEDICNIYFEPDSGKEFQNKVYETHCLTLDQFFFCFLMKVVQRDSTKKLSFINFSISFVCSSSTFFE